MKSTSILPAKQWFILYGIYMGCQHGNSPNRLDALQSWVDQPMHKQDPVEASNQINKPSGQTTFKLFKPFSAISKLNSTKTIMNHKKLQISLLNPMKDPGWTQQSPWDPHLPRPGVGPGLRRSDHRPGRGVRLLRQPGHQGVARGRLVGPGPGPGVKHIAMFISYL